MPRRVVITGMGWVTPLGHDIDAVWNRLLKGENAIGPVTRFDAATFPTNFAAEVRDFDLAHFLPHPERHLHAGHSTRYALAAAKKAWDSARLSESLAEKKFDPRGTGLYLGSGEGTVDFDNFSAANLAGWDASTRTVSDSAWAAAAHHRMSPYREIEQEPNVTLGHVAMEFGLQGPAFNCMTACAAGTQAVGEAAEIIRRGDADAMFAGGSHTMIHPLGMSGFIRLTAMSQRRNDPATAARPFDQTRDGFVMGEGAGILVLESLEHAQARGANILCEITGYGSSADAFRITDIQPQGKGAIAAMTQALRQAGMNPREPGPDGRPPIHYISAHGTGTKENDKIETIAVKETFGPQAPKVPFSSIKSMMGHLIQAAGTVELITCIKAIETGWIPPTMNLHTPDADCDLDYVPNAARDLNPAGGVHACLSNSFGFGGQNNTLVVQRF